MARNPRANTGTVPVINKFGNTLNDKPGVSAGVLDQVMYDIGAASFRSIEAGPGIEINVVDADNNRFTTNDKKIIIKNVGAGSGEANTGNNLGTGFGVFSNKTGTILNFKSLMAGPGISISSTSNELIISNTGLGGAITLDDILDVDLTTVPPLPGDALVFNGTNWVPQAGGSGGEINTASNVGLGTGVFKQKTGANLEFKTLIAGSNITLNDSGNDITINSTGGGEANTASSLGGDQSIVAGKVGVDLRFKGLTAGTNVALSASPNAVTISVPTVGEVNTGQNIGPGEGVFAQKNSSFLQFKTLVAGANTTITPAVDHLVISSASPGETNTASNIGAGSGLFANKVGTDLQFKTLVAGANITLTSDGQTVTISAAAAGEANTASNVGTGSGVFKQKVGVDLQFKKIKAGNNVAISEVGDDIVISAEGDIEGAQNLGAGAPVFALETGGQLQFRSLVAGTNTNIAYTGSEITISSTGEANTATNRGTGEGVFASKVGAQLEFKSLKAGSGVTLSSNANEITINAPGLGEANTASNLGVSGARVFASKSGVDLQFRRLLAGANISITEGANDIVIDASAAGEANTANNIGGGVGQIFKQKTGTNLEFKTIVGGTNVSITNGPDTIIIDSPDTTATASNLGVGEGIFTTKVGQDLKFKSLIQGSNITLSSTGNEITINATGEANEMANVGTTGANTAGVFKQKSGVYFHLRRLVAGTNINIAEGTNDIVISSTGGGGGGGLSSAINVGSGADILKLPILGSTLEFRGIAPGSSKVTSNVSGDNVVIDIVPSNILTSTLNNDAGFVTNSTISLSLNDLTDVNVGTPGLSENGYLLQWDNTAGEFNLVDSGSLSGIGSAIKDGENLGTGLEVFKQKNLDELQFRTLKAGTNITMTQDGSEIIINAAPSTETASNLGTGKKVFKQKTGVNFEFRTLTPGSNITLTENANDIVISAINVGTVENGLNAGAGGQVFRNKDVSNNLVFRTLRSLNSNLIITQDSDEIIFNAVGEANTASNVGSGAGLFKQKTLENLEFKSLTTSNGMKITSNTNTVNLISGQLNSVRALGIINPLTDFSLLAHSPSIDVYNGIENDPTYGPELKRLVLKSIRAGANVTISEADNTIIISAAETGGGAGEANTASNVGGGSGVFASKVGVDLRFKSLVAGTNTSITSNSTEITINSTGEANTASNVGGGNGIFANKVGVDLKFKSLVAGTNTSITSNSTEITINSTGEANTASNVGSGADIFKQKTGVDLEFRGIAAGSSKVTTIVSGDNINIDIVPSNILINDLGNVTITAPTVGQVLKYNGSQWTNQADAGSNPSSPNLSVQFNNGGVFGGNTKFTFTPTGTILNLDDLYFDDNTIYTADVTSGSANNIGIYAGNTTDSNGDGGSVYISSGNTGSGAGSGTKGGIIISTSDGNTAPGDGITIATGDSSTFDTGAITITSGSTDDAGDTGNVVISTGFSQYGNTGDIILSPGITGSVSANEGDIKLDISNGGLLNIITPSHTYTWPTVPGTASQVLTTNGAGVLSWTTITSGGTPGLPVNSVQFNEGGTFGGDAEFTYNTATKKVVINGSLDVDNINIDGNTITGSGGGNIVLEPGSSGEVEIASAVGGIYILPKQRITLANNVTSNFLSFSKTTYDVAYIDYALHRDANGSRAGTLIMIYDPTSDAVSMADTGVDVLSPGVSFNAVINIGNIDISYTTTNTGVNGTMSYTVRRFKV